MHGPPTIIFTLARYILTPYLVVIWAVNGIRAKKITDPLVSHYYLHDDDRHDDEHCNYDHCDDDVHDETDDQHCDYDETDGAQVPESIKNYVLVILIIAGCTFVLRLIVILWRMFRLPFKNLLKVQSDYKVQGQEENRICLSVRLSDPNDPKIGGFAIGALAFAFVFAFSDFVLFVQRVSSGFTSVGIFGQFI